MNRRAFLRGLLTAAAVSLAPETIADLIEAHVKKNASLPDKEFIASCDEYVAWVHHTFGLYVANPGMCAIITDIN